MSCAYELLFVYHLAVIKETKRWANHHFISTEQFSRISEVYKTPLYHPNLIIRILLFLATLLALSGLSGILGLVFVQAGETIVFGGCVVYGVASFIALERMFIAKNHFKSGVTEAVMYHACAFIIGGMVGLTGFESPQVWMFTCLVVFLFTAVRYLDLISTVACILTLAAMVFYNCFQAGGIFKQVIPFVFIFSLTLLYFLIKKSKSKPNLSAWVNNFLVAEIGCLLLIYLSGNYLVVRELSVNMMDLSLAKGEDIPLAFIFYFLTIAVPITYLYTAIKKKDMPMLRVSLILLILSAGTFKYYYSLGHAEVMLMLGGTLLIGVAIALMRYLKVQRNGFTGEDILSAKWANLNVEAFVISQTMGGNQNSTAKIQAGGGGGFSGGGASDSF